MILTKVEISRFRNLETASLLPHPSLNLVSGKNGSGKSSILEAIHCLSVGHTFRTRKPRELIAHGQDDFALMAQFVDVKTEREHRCGMSRARDGSVELRLDFEPVSSMVEVTRLLPVKALSPDSHRLMQEGPDERRAFLDWGVFHVEPRFIDAWKQFRRSLKQRNQTLREMAPNNEVESWNALLAESGDAISEYRREFVANLATAFELRRETIQSVFHVELRYRTGWQAGESLADMLSQNLEHHRRMKTTTDGPHRAELQMLVDGVPARQVLSRGQQKVFVYLLHLAQLDVIQQPAIVLCDDLVSELDHEHSLRLVEQLCSLQGQVFVSGVDLDVLSHQPHTRFHVEHGVVKNSV